MESTWSLTATCTVVMVDLQWLYIFSKFRMNTAVRMSATQVLVNEGSDLFIAVNVNLWTITYPQQAVSMRWTCIINKQIRTLFVESKPYWVVTFSLIMLTSFVRVNCWCLLSLTLFNCTHTCNCSLEWRGDIQENDQHCWTKFWLHTNKRFAITFRD